MRILYNARIRTQNPQQPTASAMAIDHGRVLFTGTVADVLDNASSNSVMQDMSGRVIWPGLIDAHIHLENYALSLQRVDCETASRVDCLDRVAKRTRQTPNGEWVIGHGWNQNSWPEGFGTVSDLDQITTNHPVYLTAKSLHAAWANSVTLQKAGITVSTTDPEGGRIGRDAAGLPNGILFESAMELVEKVIPPPSEQALLQMLSSAQESLWKVGLTSVHDFDQRSCFVALQMLHAMDRLNLRVLKGIPYSDMPHAIAMGLRTGFGDDLLRVGSVKLFADGALGPQTAAMLQPYENDASNSGILLLDSEQAFEIGQKAVSNGLSLAIHAIGDRANYEMLNAFQQLRVYENKFNLPHLRHRIEHVQILHPDDLNRLAKLQIIGSVQPIHATSDMKMADRYWGNRCSGAYAYQSMLDARTAMAFGSDAPVESPNPFLGMHAAVTRCRHDQGLGESSWYPEQRLDLGTAVHGFTTGPAYAAGMERVQGKLTPGYYADLIVLNENPFSIPPSDLYKVKPSATMVGGEWVWES